MASKSDQAPQKPASGEPGGSFVVQAAPAPARLSERSAGAPDQCIAQTGFSQSEVIKFLASREAYGRLPDKRIDTHISHVFLVGRHAYKLKKAIKLEFLDYTTLEARRLACEREIELNSKTAPQIYIGVAAITRSDTGFHFDGDGEVVDYIVMMNRFDEATLFDNLCANNDLKDPLIADLAEQVAKLHMSSEVRIGEGAGRSIEATLAGVTKTLSKFNGDVFARGAVTNWALKMEAELLRQTRRLDMRGRMGFVRQCHGDLHLGNICLINGRPTPFDAIEFGDSYSDIDVLYDLAFPIMDLVRAGSFGQANLLLNRYLEMTGDYAGLHVLPMFMSLRAGVRAMVRALEWQRIGTGQNSAERQAARRAARAYFECAKSCLRTGRQKLIAIGGISGTGKSTLARNLALEIAPLEGAIILRSDAIRKRLFHQTALVPLPSEAYSEEINLRVFRALCRDAHRALQGEYSVIVDATFLDPQHRKHLEEFANKKRVGFQGLWLEVDEDTAIARVAARTSDVSDADNNVVVRQIAGGAGLVTWTRIDAAGSPAEVFDRAREALTPRIQ